MKERIAKEFEESAEVILRILEQGIEELVRVAEKVAEALKEGGKLFFFGNAGSGAVAQHLASEFVTPYSMRRPPFPGIALSGEPSLLTGILHHYGADELFSRQLKALGQQGDVAFGLSPSGNCRNVVQALVVAKEMGLITVAMTGQEGGRSAQIAEHAIRIPSKKVSRIQEAHLTVGHILCEMVEFRLLHSPAEQINEPS